MKERIAVVSGSFAEFVNFAKENNLKLSVSCAFNETQEFFDCREWERCAGMEFHSFRVIGNGFSNVEAIEHVKSKVRLTGFTSQFDETVIVFL